MQFHASLSILFGLIALSKAWPAPLADSTINTRATTSMTPTDVLSDIQAAFVETCHNTCMKLFPTKGTEQNDCMDICHRHPNSNPGQDPGQGDM
ncbi:uncharacterized protein F4822DRAFT_418302 [Hypoxylon trugodes]|uniref:uncharacterized protein n=1 Tax=Hypoxylon trugodes TaxID=326681 RepID=UPI0021938B56|nr:uncharacterized protein F4822DRAFT_418302 [Hypoxylon trugodes]KAI1383991.1 hypothetical protein F4822DRAFT_418302 [Hypoxylon trugodes]